MKKIKIVFWIILTNLYLGCGGNQQTKISITPLDDYLYPSKQIFSASNLEALMKDHPKVGQDFFYFLLGLDTTRLYEASSIQKIAYYTMQHKMLHDTLQAMSIDDYDEIEILQDVQKRLGTLLELEHFQLPNIYSYTASIDAPAVALFPDWIGINLTLFGGEKFPLYEVFEFQSVFPKYLHHRLHKKYIPILITQQVLMDKFPLAEKYFSLMEKIINQGKYFYIMKQLLPEQHPANIFMFKEEQLKWCEDNEAKIWSHLNTTVKDVYTISPETIRTYIGEAPNTNGMPEESPGNIGIWIGYNIVSSFMDKNFLSLKELLAANPYQVFQLSGYKP